MKLKILTLVLIVVYILSFISSFSDFIEGLKEGNECAKKGNQYITLIVNQPIKEKELILQGLNGENNTAEVTQIKQTIDIEVPKTENSLLNLLFGILTIISLLLLPILIVSVFKFFRLLYNGVIVNKEQINRLLFIAYAHLPLAIVGNGIVLYQNSSEQKYAALYNLEIIKYEYNLSLFFIPIILLMIVEVLKQHLRLKEDTELTI